jgi:hypothetical protein
MYLMSQLQKELRLKEEYLPVPRTILYYGRNFRIYSAKETSYYHTSNSYVFVHASLSNANTCKW